MKLKTEKKLVYIQIRNDVKQADNAVYFWRTTLLNAPAIMHESASNELKKAWSQYDISVKRERDFLLDNSNFEEGV